jgi:hypothetical protein
MGSKGTVFVKFGGYSKEYSYPVVVDLPININDLAMQVSQQVLNRSKPLVRKTGKKEAYPMHNLLLSKLPKACKNIGIEYKLPDSIKAKESFFQLAHEKSLKELNDPVIINNNKGEKRYLVSFFRVGMSFNDRIAIDIDNNDINIAKQITIKCKAIYNYDFALLKSLHGYQIVGQYQYKSIDSWLFDMCRLLNTELTHENMSKFIDTLEQIDESTKNSDKTLSEALNQLDIFKPIGAIDIAFVLISIKHKSITLRMSRKTKDDTLIEVN